MKYWWYYVIGAILFFHPHLAEQLGKLYDYLTSPESRPLVTLDKSDLLDLILHAGLPTVLIILGLRKHLKQQKTPH